MTTLINNNLSINDLLRTSKALPPISDATRIELERLQTLDVTSYSEADVRAEIIDPVIRALGYQKQTQFSVTRERTLKVGDGNVFADFSLLLWEEEFWVIEAKKVKREAPKFIKDEVQQVLMYAAHPDINASLMVLCDGRMFHIYDRERDLGEPLLKVDVINIVRDFDLIRKLLSPWQAWFFQKRRILHLVDKVFDREQSLQRLEEFRSLIDRHLESKRQGVLERQRVFLEKNPENRLEKLKQLQDVDLIDGQLMSPLSIKELQMIAEVLVNRCSGSSFHILHRMFPDNPKAAPWMYWSNVLYVLAKLEESHQEVNWLPSYLLKTPGAQPIILADAVRVLIDHCLTCFNQNHLQRLVHLYSASARRVAKQLLIALPQGTSLGKRNYTIAQHLFDEIEITHYFSSPESFTIGLIDELQHILVARYISASKNRNHEFNVDKATQLLRDLWNTEQLMLGDGVDYKIARNGRDLGEIHPTEADCLVYDSLGHGALSVIEYLPKWKEYVLRHHLAEVQMLEQLGSHAAKNLQGKSILEPSTPLNITQLANRFTLGDVSLLERLTKSYGFS